MKAFMTASSVLVAVVFTLTASVAHSQPSKSVIGASSPAPSGGAPVTFESETLFVVYDTIGSFTPHERARAIVERLSRLSRDPLSDQPSIQAVDIGQVSAILAADTIIMAITDRDADPTGRPRLALAQEYADKMQRAVTTARDRLRPKALLMDVGLTLLATVLLVTILLLFRTFFPRLYARINTWRGTTLPSLRIQRVELLSAHQIADGLIGLAKAIRVTATVLLFYFYITSVLGLFPWTRTLSASLLDIVVSTLKTIGSAFAMFVPNVIAIAVIVVVTRYVIKLIRLLFTGVERGAITIAGFHREWIQPTYKIVRFLAIVFAAVAIFPYIPGSQSPAFQGITVFLGVLLSFGSSNAISNIIAGVVLTYMRPFQLGDRVKVAETMGDVIGRELLVTRIRTIKNVDITVPNAMVLGSHIINFSSSAKDRGLILHTSVTIGYDAPWQRVHELLIAAARATPHILEQPEPFVLQTSLDDFYVTYEINAYTEQANLMATIYAELHQNIQDRFNEAGVEIMSPHYSQIRDGNQTTIPEQYLPKNYQAPAFRIGPLGNLFSSSKEAGTAKGEPQP